MILSFIRKVWSVAIWQARIEGQIGKVFFFDTAGEEVEK